MEDNGPEPEPKKICPKNLTEWISLFQTGNLHDNVCTTVLCFPIKLPFLLLCLPCACYNSVLG
jgi:hypothetical protein